MTTETTTTTDAPPTKGRRARAPETRMRAPKPLAWPEILNHLEAASLETRARYLRGQGRNPVRDLRLAVDDGESMARISPWTVTIDPRRMRALARVASDDPGARYGMTALAIIPGNVPGVPCYAYATDGKVAGRIPLDYQGPTRGGMILIPACAGEILARRSAPVIISASRSEEWRAGDSPWYAAAPGHFPPVADVFKVESRRVEVSAVALLGAARRTPRPEDGALPAMRLGDIIPADLMPAGVDVQAFRGLAWDAELIERAILALDSDAPNVEVSIPLKAGSALGLSAPNGTEVLVMPFNAGP